MPPPPEEGGSGGGCGCAAAPIAAEAHAATAAAAVAAAPLAPCQPPVSRRVRATDPPVVAKTKAIIAASGRSDVASLAQGVVWYPPPRAALRAAARLTAEALASPDAAARLSGYGPTPGAPPLRAALRRRMTAMGLGGYSPIVTPGGQSAFALALLALCDEDDACVLFPPIYFNERMAIQMTGGADRLLLAPLRDDLRPDLDWLEALIAAARDGAGAPCCGSPGGPRQQQQGQHQQGRQQRHPQLPRVIVLVNPSNPTGVLLTRHELDRAAALAAAAGAWLVVDNTYADFVYDGARHYCPRGPHVVHLFSMSKAYGMMGWRVGWIGVPPPPVQGDGEAEGTRDAGGAAAAAAGGGGGAAAELAAAAAQQQRRRLAAAGADELGDGGALMAEILKVQDSVPIMAAQVSQLTALAALEGEAAVFGDDDSGGGGGGDGGDAGAAAMSSSDTGVDELFGPAYVAARVRDLEATNRRAVRAALAAALGESAVRGGEGGIYFFARLPPGFEARDEDAVRWLVARSGVCVLPGSACAAPGWLRVAFANLPPAACAAAAARLGEGLAELVRRGAAALDEDLV